MLVRIYFLGCLDSTLGKEAGLEAHAFIVGAYQGTAWYQSDRLVVTLVDVLGGQGLAAFGGGLLEGMASWSACVWMWWLADACRSVGA